MKRSDFFIRVITVVLFLAVASYIGVYVYNAVLNIYVTTTAINFSVEETFPAWGYIVRSETVLTDAGAAVLPIMGDGEKVASGQAVAVEYTSRDALETASELRALRLRIAQLETPGVTVESASHDNVMALSAAVHSGDLSRLDELSLNIEFYIFSGGPVQSSELPDLYERLEILERRSMGMRTIYAPVSGTFSQIIDGFEHIRPGALSEITPSGLEALFRTPSTVRGVGKLVTEFRWFYAAVMDAGDAMRLPLGRHITLQFSGAYHAQVDMLVESVGRREDGECVVLFSSDRSIHEIAPLRYMRADVIFGSVSGIRVPKEAIHLDDDGTTFIYLQTGVRAERVNVEILLTSGDSYLVRDGAETGTPLREGATIIVKANNLHDGKIVV